jgi:hypothetical protein
MAKLNSDEMRALVAGYLPEGETPLHVAYGIRQPNLWLIVPALVLVVLPGIILLQALTRHYVIGISENSFVCIRFRPLYRSLTLQLGSVTAHRALPLASLKGKPASTSTGALFTHISLGQRGEWFRAKFARAFSKENRLEAMAIGAAVVAAAG